jgi:ABC-type lipoprotein export system ATPase subunit
MTSIAEHENVPSAVSAPAAIELRGIGIEFPRGGDEGPLQIIAGYDFALERGTMHCLAGRSGSGKTSILRVAAGLVQPTAGTVVWDGQDVTSLTDDDRTARRRTCIGYVDQGGVLVPGLTAIENVLLPAVPGRNARRLTGTAMELLEQLGVANRAKSFPDRLSGGERQRVAVARALILGPSAILADEPTASLDRATADGVIEMLVSLTQRGISLLVASHDQHLISVAESSTLLT